MDAKLALRSARRRSGLTLRTLAERAHTSHSTLAAYESGRVTPAVDTFDRIVRAAGFTVVATLSPLVDTDATRGRELRDALELAAQFPARHRREMQFPVFGRS